MGGITYSLNKKKGAFYDCGLEPLHFFFLVEPSLSFSASLFKKQTNKQTTTYLVVVLVDFKDVMFFSSLKWLCTVHSRKIPFPELLWRRLQLHLITGCRHRQESEDRLIKISAFGSS